MTPELHYLTIAQAAQLMSTHRLSPVELTEALLERTRVLEPQVNAYISLNEELALRAAKRAEDDIMHDRYRGPLHGVPFALKDIYNAQGMVTSGGSKVGLTNIAQEDATTTAKLIDAGAILFGKLQTHEFAHGGPSFDLPWPPSRNPWNLEHFTGGSSSGSGAALAAGLIPASLGSDTGGSIRGPASFCGITGFMPSYGLVSRYGVIPNSPTFDHCGPMARTVEDCAILLQVIAGFDLRDPDSTEQLKPDYCVALEGNIKGLRVGVLRHYWEEDLPGSEDQRQAMEEALDVLRNLGAQVKDARARPLMDALDIKVIIAESELFAFHHADLIERPGDFGRDFLGRVLPACLFQAHHYVDALREHERYMAQMKALYENFDVLVTCGFGAAPRLDAHRTTSFWKRANVFTPANVARNPSLVLCGGYSRSGLPLGLQIIGRPKDDARVLKVGHAYQMATHWHQRHPIINEHTPQPVIHPGNEPELPNLDAAAVAYIKQTAQRSGLKLDERQMALLLEAAPHALTMTERIGKPTQVKTAPGPGLISPPLINAPHSAAQTARE
jgi:aspartyl-tRNA(Asn)/glutamyl-tRNA(Gln) amidotransferase subunit A